MAERTPQGETLRAFIAVELPGEIRAALASLQESLRRGGEIAIRWVAPEGIHLTLQFLGEVSQRRLERVSKATQALCATFGPFELTLGDPGVFPSAQRPRVLWVGLRGDLETLQRLQRALQKALQPLGFPREERAFTPHLTLGRVKDSATSEERRTIGQRILDAEWRGATPFLVEAVSLMQSTLTPKGALYRCLERFSLAAPLVPRELS